MRISDWSSDVCSSDLLPQLLEWPAKTSSDSLRSCFRGSAHVRQTSKQWRSTPSRQARICTGVSPAQSPLSVRLSKRHVFEERLQRGAGGDGPALGIVLSPVHLARSLLTNPRSGDRKSVGAGKSVAVRLGPGGRR